MELRDKVAIVTGGGGGLGRATALALAEAGARILIADIDEAAGREAADTVDGDFIRTDVSSLAENRAMVASAQERFGRLDMLFLNAGVSTGFGIDESFDEAAYRRVMGINLDGVIFGTHAAVTAWGPEPAAEGPGQRAIVATASLAGLTAVPFDAIYGANKHGVVGLTRALGPALTPRGVRFNAVCPGFAETAIITPIREMLEASAIPIIDPADVAATVVHLFSGEMSGECWFVQAGRDPAPFGFRGIPGPRTSDGVSAGPQAGRLGETLRAPTSGA